MTTQASNKKKRDGKKYLVYSAMALIFAVAMWWIFAPSAEDKDAAVQGTGFNSDIPDPRNAAIVGDKKTAYEQDQMREKQQQQMNSLGDVARMLRQNETPEERTAREERELDMAPKPLEYWENPEQFENGYSSSRGGSGGSGRTARSSASAHAELTGTLSGFFEEPKADPEKDEMAAEIERLNAALAGKESEQSSLDNQLAMMERSYQLAAKYAGDGAGGSTNKSADAAPGRRATVEAVRRENRSVVSRLAPPASDAEFLRQMTEARNRGFNTVGYEDGAGEPANTIAAVVHGDQKITDGQTVRLRTTEPMRAGSHLIPRNTIITGEGLISGERLEISVTSIEYEGNIIPVEIAVHDSDGQRGLHIPGSMEVEAFKEIVGNMGQGLGSTINLGQQSAGDQILSDLGRGVIQGTSQYVSKKARQVKVMLKAGYRLLLLPEAQQ